MWGHRGGNDCQLLRRRHLPKSFHRGWLGGEVFTGGARWRELTRVIRARFARLDVYRLSVKDRLMPRLPTAADAYVLNGLPCLLRYLRHRVARCCSWVARPHGFQRASVGQLIIALFNDARNTTRAQGVVAASHAIRCSGGISAVSLHGDLPR